MLAFQTDELTSMREEAVESMTDTATITRVTNESDGQGGQKQTTQTFTSPVRVVDLRVNRPLEFAHEGAFDPVMTYQLLFPNGTDILPKDVITINGEVFEVLQDNAVRTDNILTMATCVKVTQ